MATIMDYDVEEKAMQAYFRDGARRAMTLGNRGPVRYTADGSLHPDILDAYSRCGFYVFEDVISAEELVELEDAFQDLLERLPTAPGSRVDAFGRSAIGTDHDATSVLWTKPLADSLGGTDESEGRYQVKMYEPKKPPGLPDKVVGSVLGFLQYSDALLRLYAHPDLLRVAAAVNGEDFVPFAESIIIKKPGEGGIAPWHQDGMTHWHSPDWDEGSHGFNFMPQLYGSTAATGVWFVPGTHRSGRADLRKMMAEAGSDRLPQAVPLVCGPGGVAISNRQVVHASFANTSPAWRVTFNMGFLRRRAVQDVAGIDFATGKRAVIDDARIRERSKLIGYAIDARRQHFPAETAFVYQPHARAGETLTWDQMARESIRGYNKRDLIV
jgi:ectoine hydroxylase-related dioxygenase (phytanoyl-CoA dioxygenase family)